MLVMLGIQVVVRRFLASHDGRRVKNFVSKITSHSGPTGIPATQAKGAPGLESRTGRRLVSPATGGEKKKSNPLYFGLRM